MLQVAELKSLLETSAWSSAGAALGKAVDDQDESSVGAPATSNGHVSGWNVHADRVNGRASGANGNTATLNGHSDTHNGHSGTLNGNTPALTGRKGHPGAPNGHAGPRDRDPGNGNGTGNGNGNGNGHVSVAANAPAGRANGSKAVPNGVFTRVFDTGHVTWIDDVPVFETAPLPLVPTGRPAPRQAPDTGPVLLRAPQPTRVAPPPAPAKVPTAPELEPIRREAEIIPLEPRKRTTQSVTPAHLTWLAIVPVCVAALAGCWLAPGIVTALLPKSTWKPFPSVQNLDLIRPEPTDQVRYLVSLGAPLLVIGLLCLTWKQLAGLKRRGRLDGIVLAIQAAGLAVLAYCWVAQRKYHHWFNDWNLLAAVGVACVLVAVAMSTKFFTPGSTGSSPVLRRVTLGTVIAVTVLWLLPSVFTDANLAHAHFSVPYHLQFTFDEFVSVSNHRTPLVNFVPLYSRLLPFVTAPIFSIFGITVGTFTWTMLVLSVLSLVAVYLMFRHVTGGPLTAMFLYVPFVAVTLIPMIRGNGETLFLANLYGLVPLRIVGPFLLAWLSARELKRPFRWGPTALFFCAGLATLNNPEFGMVSFLAIGVALWCGREASVPALRRVLNLVPQAIVGALASIISVSALIYVRSSSLPRLDYLNHFQRVFAVQGFGMIPMPLFGLHVAIYLTFLAALVGALTTAITGRQTEAPVLNGMLAFSGVLGLGTLTYWVGRSHPLGLFALFPFWGLSSSLLAWWVLSAVAGRSPNTRSPQRIWILPSAAALVVFGLMVSLIAQFPAPGGQFERLGSKSAAADTGNPAQLYDTRSTYDPAAVKFIDDMSSAGERVGIIASLGHGIAERSDVVDVSVYSHPDSIGFEEQMDFVVGALQEKGARKVFLGPSYPEVAAYLQRHGYLLTAREDESHLSLWVRY